MRSWSQTGNQVFCHSQYGTHYAVMPDGWRLDDVHPSALAIAEWFIYENVDAYAEKRKPGWPDVEPRPQGRTQMLSYSGGADSVATGLLIPDAQKIYLSRDFRPRSNIHDYVESMGALIVPNDFEKVGQAAGMRFGFRNGYGYASLLVLLADFLDAGGLAFGSIMETVLMSAGHRFVDVLANPSSNFSMHRKVLAQAGLVMELPCGGCSEVLTSKLAQPYGSISCPVEDTNEGCGKCWKCFRKRRLEGGRALKPTEGAKAILDAWPVKHATSVIYAAQQDGYQHPNLDLALDLDFLNRYHPYTRELSWHGDDVVARLSELGVEEMTADDVARLENIHEVLE